MGAVITCSLGLGLGAALSAAGNAAVAVAAAPTAPAGRAATWTCAAWCAVAVPAGMRLMRSASSPSLISISAMPDSSSNSISFLIFRMSMPGMPPRNQKAKTAQASGGGGEPLRGGAHGRLVAERPQPGDDPHRDVRQIGMPAKRLAGVRVGQGYFNERDRKSTRLNSSHSQLP